MKKKIEGRARRLGNDVHIERIQESLGMAIDLFAGRATTRAPKEAGLKTSSIIVAGRNFGRGKNDNQTISAMKNSGVGGIVATSFGRDFFRDAINQGLAVIESQEAFETISDGEQIAIDIENAQIIYPKGTIKITGFPEIFSKIYYSGGLIPYARRVIGK